MRLPESRIKQAILHPEEEVRMIALDYFADTSDASIMLLVIEAVDRYGRENSSGVLRKAAHLPQTEATLDWLVAELRGDYDLSDVSQDNYRFAVGLVVLAVPLELLSGRQPDIAACPLFPKELRPALNDLVAMASWDWQTGWFEFTQLGEYLVRQRRFAINDRLRMHRLITSLGQFQDEGAEQIMALLQRRYKGTNKHLMQCMEPCIVELAGEMRLKEAAPLIFEWILEGDEAVRDKCGTALGKIGGDEVVYAIAKQWSDADMGFRSISIEALAKIHTDLSAEKCLEFLAEECDFDNQLALGHAVLSHFLFGGIGPVWELVAGDEDELIPDQLELAYHLVAASSIMDASFPGFNYWHKRSQETNYGWGKRDRKRISENFRENDPRSGGNGRPRGKAR